MIRIVIADDHHLVRQGIRALIEKTDDMQVVGEAANGQEAVRLAERLAPDVLVLDIMMPLLNGIQTTAQVRARYPRTQVLILSMYADETLVRGALREGARGYLLKGSIVEELLLAIRATSRGECYLSPPIATTVLADLLARQTPPEGATPLDRLSPREREVLQLISEGQTSAAIAEVLHISLKTVERHRANLMAKLQVHDLAGLIRLAIKHRLVSLDG
ncbi:MAG: response regulator transcription factor [Nitrospinae bacterium]|nr:response regulator transcription factor [Nitrospinota bacterium]